MLISARNLGLLKQFTYIYVSGRFCYALSENGVVYYATTYCLGDTSIWNWKNLLNFCWLSIFFDILIAYISWMVARTPTNHTIFWKSVMRTSICIYVSCFNRLRFLAAVSTKLQKIHFFEQFMNHNSGRKHGNLKNDPIFLSTFSALTVCDIHFCIWN